MVIKIMAQNTDETNRNPENCPSVILNAVPSQCQKILFTQLRAGENYKDKAIIGRLSQICPLGKRSNGYIRKLQITDALSPPENEKKLSVFLFDKFAQDSEAANLGGFLIITNFLIEKSTRIKENELPFQVLVKNEESQVLFAKKAPAPVTENSTKSKHSNKKNNRVPLEDIEQVPQKKKKVESEDESHQILLNHYDYTSLGNLQETEAKFCYNVYGIVDKCSLKVTQGKRTQILDLFLTDETETGFVCSVYAGKDEIFPDVYPGDIIRIHRMQVFKFRSKLRGKSLSAKFILVFSKNNKGSKPRTVAKSFTFTPEDSARVHELFDWYNKKSEPKLISEINRGDFANIICQVIGVYCAKNSETVILKIWDGTRTNQFESTHWGLREEILDEKLFLLAKSYYVVLSVYGQHVASAAELKPGQFIEVQDAHLYSPKNNPDDCKLCLHSGMKEDRGIRILDPEDERVQKLKERLDKITLDTQTNGNDTDDLLSHDNSVFLNCDISQFSSQRVAKNVEADGISHPISQTSTKDDERSADVEALNQPLSSRDEVASSSQNRNVEALNQPLSSRDEVASSSQNRIISVVEAAIKPGQCTQEFGEGTQKDLQEMEISEDNIPLPNQEDPVLNKTPLEFRMFLHNPPSQASPSFFPLTNDTEEEWWNSVSTVSETEGHSNVKPSNLSEVVKHEAPYKFRLLCVVLSFEPQNVPIVKMIHLCCPKCLYITQDALPTIEPFEERDELFYFYCPECRNNEVEKQNWPILEYTFLISLDLHDGTGPSKLEVLLWKEHAVKFFIGITPEEALRNKTAADHIFNMLWSICPNSRPFNSSEMAENNYSVYPILDCCIVSYTTPTGTKYQMWDTKLK